jgi:hypothetical protein
MHLLLQHSPRSMQTQTLPGNIAAMHGRPNEKAAILSLPGLQ